MVVLLSLELKLTLTGPPKVLPAGEAVMAGPGFWMVYVCEPTLLVWPLAT